MFLIKLTLQSQTSLHKYPDIANFPIDHYVNIVDGCVTYIEKRAGYIQKLQDKIAR